MTNGEWHMHGSRFPLMRKGNGRHRSAFTYVETLLAAMVMVLTATAGTTLVFAITNAASDTRGIRETKAVGQYAVSRIGKAIREARAVGELTSTTITLWLEDANEDDKVNLDEVAVLSYDGAAKQILLQRIPTGGGTLGEVASSTFQDYGTLATNLVTAGATTIIWADGIETLSFVGYPANTETRIVETQFTIGTGSSAVAFQTAASPKASADYLFDEATSIEASSPSGRLRRKHFSRWDGFADVLTN